MTIPEPRMLLFVCESNAARSPMAEAVFRHLAPEIPVQSAGRSTSHVRHEVKLALEESGIDGYGLRSKSMAGVDFDDVSLVVGLCLPSEAPGLPKGKELRWWSLPDPLCAPEDERMEAMRALRDELLRRLGELSLELSR
jgi:ArsR family transcriptional regulator, arsenate/arsenite/antimonite-responsive transcriptional repressor / arsenate reductase (thioredoxin)